MITDKDFQRLMYATYSVRDPRMWAQMPGLEFWVSAHAQILGATTEGNDIDKFGWTDTGPPLISNGSGADFLDVDGKGTPSGIELDTADDIFASPAIFGDYRHGVMAAELAGRIAANGTPELPHFLIVDQWLTFQANNDETATGVGLIEDGGAADVANDHMATIAVDGADFILRSGAATSSGLAAADTSWHHFRLKVDRRTSLVYAYVDDMATVAGSIAIQANEWPAKYGGGTLTSSGANDPFIHMARLRYAWDGWV